MPVRVADVVASEPGLLGGLVSWSKSALIEVTGPTGKVQVVSVFEQTPFHPENTEPWSGFAVSVSVFP